MATSAGLWIDDCASPKIGSCTNFQTNFSAQNFFLKKKHFFLVFISLQDVVHTQPRANRVMLALICFMLHGGAEPLLLRDWGWRRYIRQVSQAALCKPNYANNKQQPSRNNHNDNNQHSFCEHCNMWVQIIYALFLQNFLFARILKLFRLKNVCPRVKVIAIPATW